MTLQNTRSSTALHISLWSLQILLAAAFVMAGFSKLASEATMVSNFEKIGMGQWLRYVAGVIEVTAAYLLVTRHLSSVGAGLLVCTMIGATFAHLLTSLGGSAVPAMVLGGLAAVVFAGRWRQLASTVRTSGRSQMAAVPSTR